MSTTDFNYDAFFDDLESLETLSNNTNSSPRTEVDSDSGIAHTPSMSMGLDDTVIDLDNFDLLPLNADTTFPDDAADEFNLFSDFYENGPAVNVNSIFDSLFPNSDSPEQAVQEAPPQLSPPQPVLVPSPIPTITNCIRFQPTITTPTLGQTCLKVEPINTNRTIRIIKTTKPITVANMPVIQMPLIKPEEIISPPMSVEPSSAKRRRSDSPSNRPELTTKPTPTLEQLKAQYGNVNEEVLKKHLRMIKNRESASLSRKRRKDLMENLDVRVKELSDENENLKRENSRLQSQVQVLKVENELLKKYQPGLNSQSQIRKPLILMGIVLLVVFNVFTLKSLAPISSTSDSLTYFNGGRAVVPSRTILSHNDDSRQGNTLPDYRSNGISNYDSAMANTPPYPYIQCVAYINKTHSKRINQDLHSWVQDHRPKEQENDQISSKIIPDSNSLSLPSNSIASTPQDPSNEPQPAQRQHHLSRKVASHHQRTASNTKNQLEPYKNYEANYDDFIHTIDRRNDTLYFVSFKRDHLVFPATVQNQTERPKLSLILPASMANLNKSIHVPANHVPMMKIDCEVDDTKLVFVKRSHIPLSYRQDLFQYYSS